MRPANKSISIAYLRPFLASAMIAGGLVNLAAPIYAAGTAAGADISNTATASYDDANGGPTSYTVSNTVKVTVEKIAGITITGEGFTDTTAAGAYKPNDLVTFNFKITNTGNSAVNFTIPGDATVSTAGILQSVQYLPLGATDVDANWVTVTKGSAIKPTDAVPVDGFLKARVIVKIDANAKVNDPLSVQLGKTAQAPTTTTPVSNADRAGNSDATDVFTVDILTLASAPGAAINGTREASAIQSVGVQAVNKAFTDITLTGSTPTAATSPTDSKITYDLSVSVNTTAPTTGADANKNPTDLGGSPILLDPGTGTSAPANRVIISDPVPNGTTPTKLTAPAPTPGVTWLPVYSISSPGTAPELVQWKVVPVGGLPTSGVTFVGFVKSDDQPLPMSATPYTGFKIEVQTTGADLVNPTTFTNIANIYGSTPLASKLGDPANLISDQTGTPTVDTITGGTPVSTTLKPTTTLGILNGPLGSAAAAGADGSTNTDFTNKSAQIRLTDATVTDPVTGALTPLATPQPVGFSNTVKNTGTAPTKVYLLPSVPAVATDLPAGTLVKITYGADSRTYTYVISNGVGSYTVDDTSKLPISTASIAADATDVYGVSVTLPAGTAQLKGYSAPITAFVSAAAPNAGILVAPSGTSTNVTIDNVYTGFINLKKDARILTSAADAGASDTAIPFSPGTLSVKPLPGQFIQYRVKYNNITTANGGSGSSNALLNAGSLSIVEDGTLSPNNWAATTAHSKGSAVDSKGGVITYSGGTTTNDTSDTTVQKYVVNLGATTVAPGESGNFTFLRQVK